MDKVNVCRFAFIHQGLEYSKRTNSSFGQQFSILLGNGIIRSPIKKMQDIRS